jgi:hypothetical protein
MRTIHILLISCFALYLALPTVQKAVRVIPKTRLGGVELPVAPPVWTLAGWFDGSLQQAIENRHKDRISLRPQWIKTWNQLHYALFGVIPSRKEGTDIEIGKDNYLFEDDYIRTYNRDSEFDEATLKLVCANVRRAQTLLENRGIGFLLVIAPSKVEIYPELVPAALVRPGRKDRRTTYDRMAPLLHDAGVNMLDMHAQFLAWKAALPHPLFSKGGTHWNYYGAYLTVDRILENLGGRSGRQFPRIVLDRVTTDTTPEGSDSDLFKLLNLWGGISLRSSASFRGIEVHPELHLTGSPAAVKPDLLIVGDSFALTLTEVMERVQLYDRRQTLYYFKRKMSYCHPRRIDSRDRPLLEADVPIESAAFDVEDALKGRDAVIVEINEQFLPYIGFGFIDSVLARMQGLAGIKAP